ncbi:ABC transporter substrate-binding protein [Bradyrhizobium lablabi]|uniref:ABC transporter substrate-binding protein n=1 Tax=Bradyrhizobium lablabi TaxID=722472 RepID=UPI001BA5F41E|nr:ABC transporter substrate-binding protein [Bradyrhizobium lablabi]MBR0694362.1 ABC transporter substrate-binding protein [Bradyrhizobium lablabi]
MRTRKQIALSISLLVAVLLVAAPSRAQTPEAPAADTDIRIGNVMPYTGPLAAFATIGRAEAAYFDMINERGGINGRKIRFTSVDDSSNPKTALEQTRDLVEKQNVLLMFGSFGTPSNLAVRTYLNEKQVPQLFVASGDEEWAHPRTYPWTMGWQPTFRAEGRIYANYIQAAYPDRKIAVLWQNDQFGRDLFRGLQEGLGDTAGMIVADLAFDASETAIQVQVGILKDSGADILVFDGAPAIAARAIRVAAELDWHPVFILDNASASIASALRPAGLQNALGVISTSFLKDASDASWKEDPHIKAWLDFMDKYFPDGDKDDLYAVFGYAAADTLVQVLRQCGDGLSRENVMRQAASLDYQSPIALPGIVIKTGPKDFRPIKQMRLVQFDGTAWQPIGDVVDSAFAKVKDDN